MASTDKENDVPKDTGEKKSKQAGASLDSRVVEMINEAQKVPIPEKDDFWNIEGIINTKTKKKVFGIFNKKGISPDEINQLRKQAIQSPGNTRVIVNKLMKKHTQNPTLFMLSAICTHGMLMNSSNQKEMVNGLKTATKEATKALLSDGISIYNCENFLKIYFSLVERIKRSQIRAFDVVAHDPRLDRQKKSLTLSMRVCDLLGADKSKSLNVIALLKKKLKTTTYYTAILSYLDISNAGRLIEQGKPKEQSGIVTAGELIAYIYALLVAFARIPILVNTVNTVLEFLPSSNRVLYLRKVSVKSVINFTRYKIAALETDQKKMQNISRVILKENMAAIQKLDGQALYQAFETDPFFNVAFIAQLSFGLFTPDDQSKIIDTAIKAVETVIKRDMTKNHIFTEIAKTHTHRLTNLREGNAERV
ncbi:MAG: hypothetical protein HOD92_02995 [Deltaproteobacteria bacterium]|jgi:hypothetical protein|nr:hypothetical protein [Deltaproteobacteria bacterium]MBT4527782.1 hypothetical protein [Deltaproteobacteria bacterium]